MADTPNGVSSLLTDEQSKLVVEVSNSDFNAIIESTLLRLENFWTSKPTVSSTPKVSDIINAAGNLNAVIPAGFLLLHQDLDTIISSSKDNKSSSDNSAASITSFLKPMLAVAGAATVAAGIVKGLFGGISDDTTSHMQSVIDELNQNLTADNFKDDKTVLAAQKVGFIAYLEAYFLQQSASLLVSGTLQAIGEGAGKAVRSFFSSLFGKTSESSATSDKLKEITEAIIGAQTAKMYIGDESVSKAVKIGIIAYLSTYFATQTAVMAVDNFATGLSTSIGSAINGFVKSLFSGIFGISAPPKSYEHIQSIVNDLITAQTTETLKQEDSEGELDAAVRSGIIYYIDAYFKSQAKAQSADTLAASVSTAAATSVTNFLGTLFGLSTDTGVNQNLKSIADTLIKQVTVDEALKWDEIKDAKKQGVVTYIESYFGALAQAATSSEVKESGAASAGKSIRNFFSSMFGGDTDDDNTKALKSLVSGLLNPQDIETLKTSDVVVQARDQGIVSYITSYFNSLGQVSSKASDKYIKDALKDLQGDKSSSSKPTAFFKAISAKVFELSDSDMPSDEALRSIKQESILDLTKTLLKAQVNSIKTNLDNNGMYRNMIFSLDSKATITTDAQEENNQRIISTLNNINTTLSTITTYVDSISKKDTSPVVVSTGEQQSDDLSLNIPG